MTTRRTAVALHLSMLVQACAPEGAPKPTDLSFDKASAPAADVPFSPSTSVLVLQFGEGRRPRRGLTFEALAKESAREYLKDVLAGAGTLLVSRGDMSALELERLVFVLARLLIAEAVVATRFPNRAGGDLVARLGTTLPGWAADPHIPMSHLRAYVVDLAYWSLDLKDLFATEKRRRAGDPPPCLVRSKDESREDRGIEKEIDAHVSAGALIYPPIAGSPYAPRPALTFGLQIPLGDYITRLAE